MNPRLRTGLSIFFLGLLLASIALILHKKELELSGDEAPFNSIVLPPKSVQGDALMDGGSIAVIIIDADGKTFFFAFPYEYHSHIGTHYKEAYHGAAIKHHPGAIPLRDPERAKEIAIRLLDRYADPGDQYSIRFSDTLAEKRIPFSSMLEYGRNLLK